MKAKPPSRNVFRAALKGVGMASVGLLSGLQVAGQTVDFGTVGITIVEGTPGAQVFQLNFSAPAPAAGSITIQLTDGPGMVFGFGQDYWSNPMAVGGFITISFAMNAVSASFSIYNYNDAITEADETATFTITGVTGGMSIGPTSVSTFTIVDNDNATILAQGDLAVVGINANNGSCSGVTGQDEISFVCFQDIRPGTQIIMTDNGYERTNAGQWGNSEGVVRMTRTGLTIPKGTVITFRSNQTYGTTNVQSVAPDNQWTCAMISPSGTSVALNSGGDQLFFMQGGVWNNGTTGSHNATYSGTILYGFSTNGQFLSFGNSTQQSGLPLSMECFSMAPTSSTDYAKYTGPMTTNTQRGWLINFDDANLWTSNYGSCTNYNSGSPNWLSAPVLPISITGFTPGLWTGAKTTDWFDCRNWDDAKVPVASTNVVIDQSAIRTCVVTNATPATCFDLSVLSTGLVRTLTVTNGQVNAGGNVLVQRTAGSGAIGITLGPSSLLNVAGQVDLIGTAAGVQDAFLKAENSAATADVAGSLTIAAGGYLDLNGAVTGGTLYLGGDFNNNAGETDFDDAKGTVVLDGSTAQTINSPTFIDLFGTLRVNKPSNDVFVTDGFGVRTQLDLQQGRVMNAALVSLLDNATAINYSNASFVNGALEKVGNDNFVFPVGKGSALRTIAISGLTAATTDAFTAEYFATDPQGLFGNTLDPTLDHISSCEYWTLERSAGTPDASVSLSWDTPASCGVTLLPDLRVARYDGAVWRDRGNGGTTGNTTAGTVITAAQQTAFSPWTLASVSGAENPLPIELLYFKATPKEREVVLDWATATEVNNEKFIVERSADAGAFAAIGEVPGAVNSQEMRTYALSDRDPLSGFSYYRLAQHDLDGTITRSEVVSVYMHQAATGTTIIVTDGQVLADHHLTGPGTWQLLDAVGRIVRQGALDGSGRTIAIISDLPSGAYTFRASDASGTESGRFIH
ncbi:MAG: hypothetical protein H6595_10335 [Flavobacteriales bacterium]|nr:hypothetical protein [Flavobacteriales bacterium]MCB9167859.1 hypothetical protein [Flavobacteriales bacterium]